jgi:hypothetical protein
LRHMQGPGCYGEAEVLSRSQENLQFEIVNHRSTLSGPA